MQRAAGQAATERGIDGWIQADLAPAARKRRFQARIDAGQGLAEAVQRGRDAAHEGYLVFLICSYKFLISRDLSTF